MRTTQSTKHQMALLDDDSDAHIVDAAERCPTAAREVFWAGYPATSTGREQWNPVAMQDDSQHVLARTRESAHFLVMSDELRYVFNACGGTG